MSRGLTLLSSLVLFWFVCSGFTKPFFLIVGACSCLLTFWLVHRLGLWRDLPSGRMALRMLRYVPWLLLQMVKSALRVARLTLSPSLPVAPAFGWVKSPFASDMAHSIYANSITLTPGTVSVDMQHDAAHGVEIYVHALEPSSLADLAEPADPASMAGRIQRMAEAV